MNNHDISKSGLFLIELILSIFFFIIAMAVCLQLFVKAHTLSNDAVSMNQAVFWTQNLSELFLGSHGDYATVKKTYENSDSIAYTSLDSETHLLILLDKNWDVTHDLSHTRYYVLAQYSCDDNFAYEDIYVVAGVPNADFSTDTPSSDTFIHHLQVKKYMPKQIIKRSLSYE